MREEARFTFGGDRVSQVKDPCGERSSAAGIDDSWKDSFGRPIVSIIRLFVNRPCAHAQWMDEEEEGESDELLFLSKEEEEVERRKWIDVRRNRTRRKENIQRSGRRGTR